MTEKHSDPTEQLSLLSRLMQEFISSIDFNEVLARVMDEVIAVLHAERGLVMLYDTERQLDSDHPSTDQLVMQIARGMDQNTLDSSAFLVSRGIVEQTAREGVGILTSDAQSDPRFNSRESVFSLGLHSLLCTPLIVKSQVIGVIYVDNRLQSGIFDQDDLDLLSAIAGYAAAAIENSRLHKKTQQQLQTLQLLYRISQDITATLDLDRVLTACIQTTQEALAAQAASVITIEDDELVFQVSTGEKSEIVKLLRMPVDQGVAGWCIQNQQGTIVNDAHADARFYSQADSETGFITQNILAAPLIVNERAIGVIEVFNKPEGFTPTDLSLLETIASSAAFAIENARLYQVAIEKGRLERELQVARRVQASLIPQRTPQHPGWQFAARWLPARQVAGDYYDFFEIPGPTEKQLIQGLVIADVTDKGMPAALFMATVRSILRASMLGARQPAEGLAHTNQLLSADSTDSMFVSLFYAQLDPKTGDFTYVNAGHNPPILFRAAGDANPDRTQLLTRTGMVLGVMQDAEYTQAAIQVQPGEILLLYTDGISEAINAREEMFGAEHLIQTVLAHQDASPEQIVSTIEMELEEFIGTSAPFDDITLMVIKRLP